MDTKQEIIQRTISFVKKELENAEGGHDWFHIERVWKNAKKIAQTETVNGFIVEMAALLHDIADSKFQNGNEEIGPSKAQEFLASQKISTPDTHHIISIIRNISFKGGNHIASFHSPELAVVQDADRLDALGAIGIARAFNYGGFKNRVLYNPAIPPNLQMSKEEYKNSAAPTLNHFYEKLLLLKDRMHTETAKNIAEERHQFMLNFLDQFYAEWEAS